MARRKNPDINAGSMADIAFLLLIFFLVTTTMDVDAGIVRKLPEKSDSEEQNTLIAKQNNVLEIQIEPNTIKIKDKENIQLSEIRNIVKDFVDNGAGIGNPLKGANRGLPCDYCQGAKDPLLSEHPNKAIISIQGSRNASYGTYVGIQNELEIAYKELRNRLSKDQFGVPFVKLQQEFKETGAPKVKEKIDYVRERYPKIISESSKQSSDE